MVRLKFHSQYADTPYDFFPNHKMIKGQPFIDCYSDGKINEYIKPNSIALMVEPRPLQEVNYKWLEKNYGKFKKVVEDGRD